MNIVVHITGTGTVYKLNISSEKYPKIQLRLNYYRFIFGKSLFIIISNCNVHNMNRESCQNSAAAAAAAVAYKLNRLCRFHLQIHVGSWKSNLYHA